MSAGEPAILRARAGAIYNVECGRFSGETR